MKSKILCLIMLTVLSISGCSTKNAADTFLLYKDSIPAMDFTTNSELAQDDFFGTNKAIVTDEDNKGGDTSLTAGASLLINRTDNMVVYADNVYNKLYPASLTKLLTALVALRYGEMTDMVTVSYDAVHISEAGAKLCGFEEGDVISLEALINSMLIYSGNDAAIAVADHIAGSEKAFVEKMNEEARNVGAIHSNFVNSNGLHDDNQYTTAYDMYLIFNELLKFDTFRNIINSDSYTADFADKNGNAKQKTFPSTNKYFSGEEEAAPGMEVIGGKTGTTKKAGNCLILLSKDTTGNEYVAVILKAEGSDELYSDMSQLLTLAENK